MSALPAKQNKLFRMREVQRDDVTLAKRLKQAKSIIDDGRPKSMSVGRVNRRKIREAQDRDELIYKHNSILLGKISEIATRDHKCSSGDDQTCTTRR